MIKENPNRKDCILQMKEYINDEYEKDEIIKICIKDFEKVHKSTFYDWYEIAEKEIKNDKQWLDKQTILSNENYEKAKLKKQLFSDAKKDYENETDPKIRSQLRKELNSYLKGY